MYRLMIVEDDRGIAAGMEALCRAWGYEVKIAEDFRCVDRSFQDFRPHLVLLDISLPFYDGYHWCREIRKTSKVPIVFISSASDNMNIVMAMSMGGDDFIAKPFDAQVLTAKLQAILRRTYDFTVSAPLPEHKGARLNTEDSTLEYRGEKIQLTKNEYRILYCLLQCKGQIVSREKLMERLWETDQFVDENTLTVNINRLRKKLDSYWLEEFIHTRIGQGYVIS